MPNFCPWCGVKLETKTFDIGDKFREVCSRCRFKIKEYLKPEPKVVDEKNPAEVKDYEKPEIRTQANWPFILGGVIVILLLIIVVRLFLV